MAPLSSKARASLPDSAFAYIDSKGRRRLPINDKAHVQNALARFNQTMFEDEAARDRARTRLLKATKRYGIVPIGFMTGQLRSSAGPPRLKLPAGFLTLLFIDVEDSSGLVHTLGDGYARFINDLRGLLRAAIQAVNGYEVDARADEMFAVFQQAHAGVEAGVAILRSVAGHAWPDDLECKLRIGLHSGRPTASETSYVGVDVNTAARVCAAAHGGQLLVSHTTREAVEGTAAAFGFRELGRFKLRGLPGFHSLYQVTAAGLADGFPVPRADPEGG